MPDRWLELQMIGSKETRLENEAKQLARRQKQMKGLVDDDDAEYWDISTFEKPAKITFHDWKLRS